MQGCSFSAKAISVLLVSRVPSKMILGHSFEDIEKFYSQVQVCYNLATRYEF